MIIKQYLKNQKYFDHIILIMDPLRECQINAMIEFEKHFYIDEETRGIVSMCCGAGKTRTIYEMIKFSYNQSKENNLLFILATSRIHLIYQIGQEWQKYIKIENLPFKLRFVGGGGEKEAKRTLRTYKEIRREIQNCCIYNKIPLIIVTTYQSSKNIIDAVDGDSKMFPEMIIMDEAHNCTGENKDDFQALIKPDNDQFNAEKFVFMTATPVQLLLKNKNAPFTNKETIFTMDNKNIFGKIVYQYSFFEGIKDGIITDFKTIYYEKNSDKPMSQGLIDELKDKTKAEKQKIYFRTVCNFILESIKTHDLKYILVYCSNQTKAEQMKKLIMSVADEINFDCWAGTILSHHSKKERETTLKLFERKSNEPHLLFSVGIFDEGVDIRCIDAVCFSEERSSESRIVQNVGRCLRTYPGKKLGHVIIPNIVHEFESENNDISTTYSSHFKKIRYVLKQMKSPIGNVYWDKFIKSDHMTKIIGMIDNDPENDELEDLVQEADELIIEKNDSNKKFDENETNETNETISLAEHYLQQSTFGSIANEQLSKIKALKPSNVTTIEQWCMYALDNSIPYVLLHKDFKTEWISYGDFLINNTLKYEEAKKAIKDYFIHLTNPQISNAKEWDKFFEETIYREKANMRKANITDKTMNIFIQIPNRPKDYYKGEWKDWEDFLGLQINQHDKTLTVGLSEKSSGSEKANQNIDVLVNKDQNIIQQYAKGLLNDIQIDNESTDIIKRYLQKKFRVPFDIKPKVCIKKNGSYDKLCIHCALIGGDFFNAPIIIYPEVMKLKYDGNAIKKVLSTDKCNRTEEEYINDSLMKLTMIQLISDSKELIQKYNELSKSCGEKQNHSFEVKENLSEKIKKVVKVKKVIKTRKDASHSDSDSDDNNKHKRRKEMNNLNNISNNLDFDNM